MIVAIPGSNCRRFRNAARRGVVASWRAAIHCLPKAIILWCVLLCTVFCKAQLVSAKPTKFDLGNVTIYTDSTDETLVLRSATLLQQDIEMVTGKKPAIIHQLNSGIANLLVIGSQQHSSLLQLLQQKKMINLAAITGKWEAYQVQTVSGSKIAAGNIMVIAGSDRRGTAYGVFELSKQMGVSPWYWWADVPVKKQTALYINPNEKIIDSPLVKYRGFFINDEAPCLSSWSKATFGGFNHQFYEKVFELLLRLKANYLWPAMWGNAFNADDTLNPVLADEYGIVMGTSHHEPMLRAQQEWKRFGTGAWDYTKNDSVLRAFWRQGMINRKGRESIITVGMRGDGDMPMTKGTATELLEHIVADQRKIIEDVTQKPAAATPQLWALYKEVQDYYDAGMRVPDDVTLLLCDDNWGNIRRLPRLGEPARKGGYGIYYHFDYVGGPRNYKWLNTNPLPRVWEQMHLAYEYNVKQIWVVNVGDIKPMELPISFFLDYAWNPERIGPAAIHQYTVNWAAAQFGAAHAEEIAGILEKYTKFNGRRKPELLDANTYNLQTGEWAKVVNEYNALQKKAESVNSTLPSAYRDAYFELVLHPVKACANLNAMYYNAALNKEAYANHWAVANVYADKVKELYDNDSLITLQYHQLKNGKWNYMMSQTHIGYTYWQQPPVQKMPEVKYVPLDSVKEKKSIPAADEARSAIPSSVKENAFYEEESNGVVIEAYHFAKAANTDGITWTVLPDLGRTASAVEAFPVTAKQQQPGGNAPHLEYEFYTLSKGTLNVNAYFSPTLNFQHTEEGLQYAVSIDDEVPQVISINKEDKATGAGIWNKWVAENIIIKTSTHTINTPGRHVLKYWMVNPGVVLQRIVIDRGQAAATYLGPAETKNSIQ
ncbi:MAG: glycosyl hydrolase 115 family protein [Bacteroidetes bacterium]|nr:glycosyl hydrolase 115 family protein [Bacteroidota bacterium]